MAAKVDSDSTITRSQKLFFSIRNKLREKKNGSRRLKFKDTINSEKKKMAVDV